METNLLSFLNIQSILNSISSVESSSSQNTYSDENSIFNSKDLNKDGEVSLIEYMFTSAFGVQNFSESGSNTNFINLVLEAFLGINSISENSNVEDESTDSNQRTNTSNAINSVNTSYETVNTNNTASKAKSKTNKTPTEKDLQLKSIQDKINDCNIEMKEVKAEIDDILSRDYTNKAYEDALVVLNKQLSKLKDKEQQLKNEYLKLRDANNAQPATKNTNSSKNKTKTNKTNTNTSTANTKAQTPQKTGSDEICGYYLVKEGENYPYKEVSSVTDFNKFKAENSGLFNENTSSEDYNKVFDKLAAQGKVIKNNVHTGLNHSTVKPSVAEEVVVDLGNGIYMTTTTTTFDDGTFTSTRTVLVGVDNVDGRSSVKNASSNLSGDSDFIEQNPNRLGTIDRSESCINLLEFYGND